ncbi:tryptophan-rich sensory protein [Hymenobacter terrenus]|uniref:tryptophan-rich sensory protein n=1 Tax=Hymenobacter terrenus TaxID=1629124 RepID=UPI00061989E0|nr:TspO/MBR family protein [Hymenobacter terrenus]
MKATTAPRYRWWHGALFLGGITAVGALTAGRRKSRERDKFYESEKLPVWAPPAVTFPIIWPLNNLALTWGGLRLLNAPRNLPHRRELLALQAVLWVDFVTYGIAYFGLRSPVLSAVWTLTDTAASVASLVLARRTGDDKLPNAYLPITAWTCFASTIAAYDALRNPDHFLGTSALLTEPPVPALEKVTPAS